MAERPVAHRADRAFLPRDAPASTQRRKKREHAHENEDEPFRRDTEAGELVHVGESKSISATVDSRVAVDA